MNLDLSFLPDSWTWNNWQPPLMCVTSTLSGFGLIEETMLSLKKGDYQQAKRQALLSVAFFSLAAVSYSYIDLNPLINPLLGRSITQK